MLQVTKLFSKEFRQFKTVLVIKYKYNQLLMPSVDDVDFKTFRITAAVNSFGFLGFFKVLILAD